MDEKKVKTWAEVSVHTSHEAMEAVANILHEAGASGVVIEDALDLQETVWKHQASEEEYLMELDPNDYPEDGIVVKAYFPVNRYLGETVDGIKSALSQLPPLGIDVGKGSVTLTEVHEEDWANAWKKYYKPVRVSQTITIVPTWESYTPQREDEQVIRLDPGMAFGTGTHPTTILCIQALEKYLKPGMDVIDVGCGSGVLSIASVKLGAKRVLALDIDELAVKVCQENVAINGMNEKITVQRNNLLDGIQLEADLIVANILAEVIVRFSDQAFRQLRPGGIFIASGIISSKREMVEEGLRSHGFTLLETVNMDEWLAIVAQKV